MAANDYANTTLPQSLLLEHATRYYKSFGFNVVPVKGKAPCIKWKHLETEALTAEEFRKHVHLYNSPDTTGIGVITGIGHIRCLDFDKCLSIEPVKEVLKALGLPENYEWVVQTGRGYHVWMICEEYPGELDEEVKSVYTFYAQNKGLFDHLELRWNANTVLPQSMHMVAGVKYTFLNCAFPEAAPAVVPINKVVKAVHSICIVDEPEQQQPKREQKEPESEYTADIQLLIKEVNSRLDLLDYAKKHLPDGHIQKEERGEIRVGKQGEGYGTILIREKDRIWNHPQNGWTGGSAIQLVIYKRSKFTSIRSKGKEFIEALQEACDFAGVIHNLNQKQSKKDSSKPAQEAGVGPRQEEEKRSPFELALEYLTSNHSLLRNEVTMCIEDAGRKLSEQEINGIYIDIRENGRKISKTDFDVLLNSNRMKGVNPIKDFFERRTGKIYEGHIEKLADSIVTVHHGPQYIRTFLKKWLVGMVASIDGSNYNPLMLVLIGGKNIGKTEFFRRLLPDGLKDYSTGSKLGDGKDSEALMCEMLLILNDELDGMHSKEAKTFRNFISANRYTYRPPYGKQNVTRKRLATVCGTSNEREIINDWENNRRVIPFEISYIDKDRYNAVDKTALLMEAYQCYKSGYDWNLTADDIDLLGKNSSDYKVNSMERELVMKYYQVPIEGDVCTELTNAEILTYLTNMTRLKINPKNLGAALKELGFVTRLVKYKTGDGKTTTKQVYKVIDNTADT